MCKHPSCPASAETSVEPLPKRFAAIKMEDLAASALAVLITTSDCDAESEFVNVSRRAWIEGGGFGFGVDEY